MRSNSPFNRRLAIAAAATLAWPGSVAAQLVATQEAALTSGDAEASDWMGKSVSLDGDTAVVGAPQESSGGANAGAAYVFVRNGSVWSEQAKLVAVPAAPGSEFGTSVGISGDTIVVGAPLDDTAPGVDTGSVHVFVRSGTSWSEQTVWGGIAAGAQFGYSVSVDDDTAAVGAWRAGGETAVRMSGLAFDPGAGRLYGVDSATNELVSIDLVLGRATPIGTLGFPSVEGLAFDPGTNTLYGSETGTDQLVVIDTTTGSAQVIGPLGFGRVRGLAFDPLTGTLYGSDNPTRNLIVIDPATGAGTAVGGFGVVGVRGLAFDPTSNTLFGSSVFPNQLIAIDVSTGQATAIGATTAVIDGLAHSPNPGLLYGARGKTLVQLTTASGNEMVVGPFGFAKESGMVHVFVRSGTSWSEQAILAQSNPQPFDFFGDAVAVHGDTVVVGAYGTDQGGSKSGLAWAFRRSGTSWGARWKLAKGFSNAGDLFGYAVDVYGDRAVVGSPRDSYPGGGEAGTANVFFYNGTTWGSVQELKAADGADGDRFGRSVSIEGTTVLIGADRDDHLGGVDAGSAYVFDRNPVGWSQHAKFAAGDASTDDRFGISVSLSGSTVAVGAYLDDHAGGVDAGSTYVFELSPTGASYCTAGTSASGCRAALLVGGTPSASASSGFTLSASNVEGAKDGVFFHGTGGRQATPWGNGTSFQCVVPPVKRGGLMIGSGSSPACDGSFALDLNARWCPTCPKPQHNPGAGAVVQAQLWFRDPWNTSNQPTSLSDAVEFTVMP